jgi:hypothetical protein
MSVKIFSREILFILPILSIHVRISSPTGFNIDKQDRQDELRRNQGVDPASRQFDEFRYFDSRLFKNVGQRRTFHRAVCRHS